MQIVLNGVEFDLDITDAETIDRLPFSVANLQGQIALSKTAVEQCDLIDCFVADILGPDAVQRIFKNKRNVLEYAEVIKKMFDMIEEQVKAFNAAIKSISEPNATT